MVLCMRMSAVIWPAAPPIRQIILAAETFRNGQRGGNQSGKVRFAPLKNSISAA
jgi:hypothetical protein